MPKAISQIVEGSVLSCFGFHYLNTHHSGYGISALALVIQNDYLQYLYQVVQSSYDNCEFYHCISSCASSDDWTTPTLALGSCANTLTYPLTSIPQNDELINANLYYCYSEDFEGKIHPNLLTSFTNSHIVAANSNAFEEAVAAFPYRNLVLMMHGSGGNTSLFSFQMHCNKEKLAETIYRLYPHEFLDIVKNYVTLNTILGSFSIFVNYDEPSTIIQLISPGILATYLESNYSGDLTSILNDFSSTYGSLLGRISYQAFEECEFKDCVLEHWPGIGVDSSLIYNFIREHHWVNALKNILLNQEDDFNKQFSYLYPTMLAEVLETYTPEARYSMSTFLDGVESYFGYETRRAISTDSTQHYGLLVLNELHMYGSARLGMIQTHDTLFEFDLRSYYDLGNTQTPEGYNLNISQPYVWDSLYTHQRGSKVYEGTNHLGNVLVTFSDKRIAECQEDTIYRYVADVKSQTDYSAFGVLLEERQWYSNSDTNSAIYGFNGMRKDNEIYGSGNAYDFGARMYNSRIGSFLSSVPRWKEFPANSPFCYAANNPVRLVDIEGEGPGDPIFSFGFKSDFSLKANTSVGIFASVIWKQSQASFNSISMEGGARGELNFYSRKWGNGGVGVDGSAQAFFGLSVGPDMTPAYRGFVNSGHQFAGSGIASTSPSGTIGWNQTIQFGSNVNGENINQRIGGPYLRGDWKSGSVLASHLNDMWGDGRDGYDGANGHATYTNFGTNTWQAGYSFQIVTPQPNVINGIRESSSDNRHYITSNSKVNYFQESSLNFQMQTNKGDIGVGMTSRGNWTQDFWQNQVAHKNGKKYPMFLNTGTPGFKPGLKFNYTSPSNNQ